MIIIGVLLQDWKNFNACFEKLRFQREYLKKEQLAVILSAVLGPKDKKEPRANDKSSNN
jgi:hypothetical protein